MTIRLVMEDGEKLGSQFEQNMRRKSERMIKAVAVSARRAKDEIEFAGREDIRAGGDFGSRRWQEGFRAALSFPRRGVAVLRMTHSVPYWKVFEFGATILGKPLLWIPLSFGNAFGVRARDYPKPLFRVDRQGKAPLLLDDQGPQYFGKESVTIPKKWHLRAIVRRISRKIPRYYREAFRNAK